MEIISRLLLTFLLNSLWQIPLVAAVAWLACRLMRNGPRRIATRCGWRPWRPRSCCRLASIRGERPIQGRDFRSLFGNRMRSSPRAPRRPRLTARDRPRFANRLAGRNDRCHSDWRVLAICAFSARPAGVAAVARSRWGGRGGRDSDLLERVCRRCQEDFGVKGVELLFSDEISGPVTAGGVIILPQSLLGRESEEMLTTAIGHEMAHIARQDFALEPGV